MKTKPMKHQTAALKKMKGRKGFALLMEQGTGKTWTMLKEAEEEFEAGTIAGMLVTAPKGVHTNWVRREIPQHLSVRHTAYAYKSTDGVKAMEERQRLWTPPKPGEFRFASINIDAFNTVNGREFAGRFLNWNPSYFAIDESKIIANPKAKRTENLFEYKRLGVIRRIATGTPVTKAPTDLFMPFQFLESGLLGTDNYRAFNAEFAELLSNDHPLKANIIAKNPRAAWGQMIARNPDGTPIYRNLDKLARLVEPHSFRVLKRDCLDLPPKVYKNFYFDLSPSQQRAYHEIKELLQFSLRDGETILTVRKLAALTKLQQITSGFFIRPDGEGVEYIEEGNTRIEALMSLVPYINGAFIVWARFDEEIRAAVTALKAEGLRVVEYHGRVKDKDREAAIDDLQSGKADVLVAQTLSNVSRGQTLTKAETVIILSNWYDLELRKQLEDRSHRKGTINRVLYIDIVADGTIDEDVASNLQAKDFLASAIFGDPILNPGERLTVGKSQVTLLKRSDFKIPKKAAARKKKK